MKTFRGTQIVRHLQLLVVGLLVLTTCRAQGNDPTGPTTPQEFRAGGVSVAIPSPADDLVEMGPDLRVLLDVLVPDANRLLAAFVTQEDLAELPKGKKGLSRYCLVEVSRRAEFIDIDEAGFKQVADGVSKQMGTSLDATVKTETDAINRKIAALGAQGNISIEKTVSLGPVFSKPNAFGIATLVPVSVGGKTTTMVGSSVILRARNRLIFGYVFMEYKDKDSAAWVSRISESWADAVLKANQ